jgi:hypothetical protein
MLAAHVADGLQTEFGRCHDVRPSVRTTGRVRSHVLGAARTNSSEVVHGDSSNLPAIISLDRTGEPVAARLATPDHGKMFAVDHESNPPQSET